MFGTAKDQIASIFPSTFQSDTMYSTGAVHTHVIVRCTRDFALTDVGHEEKIGCAHRHAGGRNHCSGSRGPQGQT